MVFASQPSVVPIRAAPDRWPILEMPMVSIDISDVSLT
jgi:hypothetical protein